MLTGDLAGDLSTVQSYTERIVEEAFEAKDPVLVESPPSSGKTTTALQLAATSDTPVTYLCGRTDLYEEAKRELEESDHNVDFVKIPSPHRDCDSFKKGSPGNQEKLKKLYNKGYSGRKLHFLPKENIITPCGENCEYLKKLDKVENRIDEIDVLIGHHSHAHRDHYVKDRIVILDEFNADAFISSYPNPGSDIIDDPEEIIPAFLEGLADNDQYPGFPSGKLRDFTDLLVQRQDDMLTEIATSWFTTHGASRGDAEEMEFLAPSSYQHNRDHLLAPFLTLGILCMERVGPDIEMAPHPDSNVIDVWKDANLNPSTRVVRNRNTSKMTVLRPPDFSRAEQVVGLDGTPTLDLWNLLLPPNSEFDLQRVVAKSDFTEYLESGLNMSLIQIGGGMHHYATGHISSYDRKRFRAVKALEHQKIPLISSKQAIQEYKDNELLRDYVAQINLSERSKYKNTEYSKYKASNFASIKSSNAFKNESIGMVFGTPYPGDDVIKRWAGLCGVGVEPEGKGKKKTFNQLGRSPAKSDGGNEIEIHTNEKDHEGIGNQIYKHYVHNQVVQAILRFGRDESVIKNGGATVYISTHALPAWVDITKKLIVPTKEKRAAIIEQLYEVFATNDKNTFSYQTAKSLMGRVEASDSIDSISERYVCNTLNILSNNNIAECREGYGIGGADQYRWNAQTCIESALGYSIVHGTDRMYVLNSDLDTT